MLRTALVLAATMAVAAASNPDWVRQGRTEGSKIVGFSVACPERNLDQLDEIFRSITDPDSPQYGQYKEGRELNQLTASDPQDIKDAWNFFETHGAKCKAFWSHLECRAAVKDVERIFEAEMYDHEHKESGFKVSRIGGSFAFPSVLEGKVDFVTGLTQLPVARYGRKTAAAGNYNVVPETLYSLYNINAQGSSQVSQSAIEFQGYPAYSEKDLDKFIQNTGIKSFTIQNKIGPFNPSFPGAESTLDVQYLGAVGQGNTNWYWTESQWLFDFSNKVTSMSRDQLPDVMSMSYGWNEEDQCQIAPGSAPCSQGNIAYVQRTNTNFQKIGAMGITLLASSGDSGSHGRSDKTCNGDELHPAFPASSPYVTAVGATMFEPNSVQTGGSEPVCRNQLTCATGGTEVVCTTRNGDALITSGGGFSNVAGVQDYQKAAVEAYLSKGQPIVPPTSTFNTTGRGYPDVSAMGHAYYIELYGQLQSVDGTSASCPVFAGVVALLNAHRVENGKPKIGFANPLLYKMAAQHPNAFNDITSGDNKCTEADCCSTGFTASQGWDATTGLGTPNVAAMLQAMQRMDGSATPSDKVLAAARALRG